MLIIIGISERIAESLKARKPAAVLRRTRPRSFEAHRVLQRLDVTLEGLNHDGVRPRVARVVFVSEAVTGHHDLGESVSLFIGKMVVPIRVGDPISSTANLEGVKMAVLSPHGDLDDVVELRERAVTGNEHSSPYLHISGSR